MRTPAIVMVVLAAADLLTISTALAQNKTPEETVAVRGMVVDESGAPVAEATVSVRHYPQTNVSARSAADGSFTLSVPRRSFDGVLIVASDEKGERLGTLVHPDQGRGDQEPIKIVLRKAHKLDVTVTDAQGELVTGARVAAVYRQQTMAEQTTDEGGRAVLRVPADVQIIVYGVKRDVGFEAMRLAPESYEQLTLALQPTNSVRIQVIDDRQRPIGGAKVHPLSTSRAAAPPFSISLYDMAEFLEKTDEGGSAVCHIPVGNVVHFPQQISIEAEGYIRPPIFWMSEEAIRQGSRMSGASAVVVSGNEFTIQLKPTVTIRGSVVHADGRPAAGASAGALGYGYDKAGYVQGTQCEADGSFKLSLSPGLYYVFTAQSGNERSPYQKRVILADRPSEPLKLVLEPARRLFGTLTSGPENAPVARQHLTIYWRDDESYGKLPPEERLPNPTNDPAPIVLAIFNPAVRTDDRGQFEFLVAPGRYYIAPPDKARSSNWYDDLAELTLADVTEQSEARVDLHTDKPQ